VEDVEGVPAPVGLPKRHGLLPSHAEAIERVDLFDPAITFSAASVSPAKIRVSASRSA
jgi:hypothetical protein